MVLKKYLSVLQNLIPSGLAWPRVKGTNMDKLLTAVAGEPARVDIRVSDMLTESYPLTSAELLPDWERITGLPEKCDNSIQTIQRRREAVHRKLSTIGNQSPQYFIDVASDMGFSITITEFEPFRAGHNSAGEALNGKDWGHAWQVNAPEETIKYFASGEGAAGEPLATWGNEVLECIINQIKPAHTIVIYAYAS